MFAQPVDPVRDNVPHYFDIVKNPMDLSTVRHKLDSGQYQSVSEWKDDMELIWKNSLLVNSRTSILGYITVDMQEKYRSLVQFFTDSQDYDWLQKLYFLRDELNGMSKKAFLQAAKREQQKASKINKSGQLKQSKQRKQPLTRAEIIKLSNDINELTDDIHILSIFDIFKKYEPQIETDCEVLKVDIAFLKPTTLWALRETVDNIMGIH